MREYDPTWGVPSPAPAEPERERRNYTEASIQAAIAGASGTSSAATIEATAAAEIAAGIWGRAFAAARVDPVTSATRALTPEVLSTIGRELILRGEAAFEIVVRRGRLELDCSSWWNVRGGARRDSWVYDLSISGPDTIETRTLVADRVVHPRYAVAPNAPWTGLSPLALQRNTAALAANLELRLGQEAGGQVGQLIAVPDTGDDDLKAGLKSANGRVILVPTTSSGFEGLGDAPRQDWSPKRLGGNPPESLRGLRGDTMQTVLAACAVPVELLQRADGTALREAYRQFVAAAVQPVGRQVARELAEKLDAPGLRLEFGDLAGSDLAGRARAFAALVKSGVSIERAAAQTGLLEPE